MVINYSSSSQPFSIKDKLNELQIMEIQLKQSVEAAVEDFVKQRSNSVPENEKFKKLVSICLGLTSDSVSEHVGEMLKSMQE